ncbi:MAG: hypothetical protein ACR2PO_08750, partial [Methyloligellaceae bacterium]
LEQAGLTFMLRLVPLLIKHRRLLLYFAPLVLDLIKSNQGKLKALVDRPDTTPRQDLEDAWRDGDFGWTDP